MLPLICLPECATCGTNDQGTRAKGGNSVRCAGCNIMRRVPMDRRTYGPDDPSATRPQRGRPFPPGHPHRFQPSTTPRPTPATTTPRPPASKRQRPAQSPPRPTPAARPGMSFASLVQTMLSGPQPLTSSTTGTPRRPVYPPARPTNAPAVRAPELARRPDAPVRRPAARGPEKPRVPFIPYRACEHCVIDGKRGTNGQYAAAVVKIGAWMNDQPRGIASVCPEHLAHFEEMARSESGLRIAILEEPSPVLEMKAMNCRYGNHTWYTPPGTTDTRCAYCSATPDAPAQNQTYVNPTTCPHANAYYDASADAWRCPDCYDARPAYL